jgi:tetratricopeptide (TPR) repeat protein
LWWLVRVWWRHRDFRYLLQGLPAILVGGGVVALSLAAYLRPTDELVGRYLNQAKSAFQAKDYPSAFTCYDRLAHLAGDNPEVLFGLAQSAEALKHPQRAVTLMSELAPLDKQGYAPAHLWIASRMLGGRNLSLQDVQAAETHLLRALNGQVEDREAVHERLGLLYLGTRRWEQAELYLSKAVKTRPWLGLELAQALAMRAKPEEAKNQAQNASKFFRQIVQNDAENHAARVSWARCALFLEDYPDAVTILRNGLGPGTQNDFFLRMLAEAYGIWSDAEERNPNGDPGKRLALLEQGLRYDPANVPLLNRLAKLMNMEGEKGDKARDLLRELLAQGKAPAVIHSALGSDAYQRGQIQEAQLHWEQAFKRDPQMAVVANNLAWLYANTQPPDLPRALQMIDAALQLAPNWSEFRSTKGHILVRMERWKEALEHLIAALKVYPDSPELHHALAMTYDKLGDPDMAAVHRRLAEAKAKKPAPADPSKPAGGP